MALKLTETTALRAAEGIARVVNTNMAEGIKIVSVRRGVDPRRFALVSFGGAAGLHVTEVARLLEIRRVIVPSVAAVLSAWGMLATDLRYELVRSHVSEVGRMTAAGLRRLFAALERSVISFEAFDLTRAAFSNTDAPKARLYFNQASPSAYVRGNTRAVPLALAYMRSLERLGARVLNGADVFALELSKSAQATLLRTMGIDTPWSITFNDVSALRAHADHIRWPAILKPDQGGSGARIRDGGEALTFLGAFLPAVASPDGDVVAPMGPPSILLFSARAAGTATIDVMGGDPFASPRRRVIQIVVT